jgi:methionine--tRNA ligase beta chain
MKKPLISYPEFDKLDIRVGEVIEAGKVENSNKLIFLKVDLGEDYGVVEIYTGMAKVYEPAFFVGKKFFFLANLEPKKMLDKMSCGMLLCADIEGKPVLQEVNSELINGTLIH